tara:strand:+ start:57 stop:347 length:291 start_codon:yes stop_codon:yes gene_type:complete
VHIKNAVLTVNAVLAVRDVLQYHHHQNYRNILVIVKKDVSQIHTDGIQPMIVIMHVLQKKRGVLRWQFQLLIFVAQKDKEKTVLQKHVVMRVQNHI